MMALRLIIQCTVLFIVCNEIGQTWDLGHEHPPITAASSCQLFPSSSRIIIFPATAPHRLLGSFQAGSGPAPAPFAPHGDDAITTTRTIILLLIVVVATAPLFLLLVDDQHDSRVGARGGRLHRSRARPSAVTPDGQPSSATCCFGQKVDVVVVARRRGGRGVLLRVEGGVLLLLVGVGAVAAEGGVLQ